MNTGVFGAPAVEILVDKDGLLFVKARCFGVPKVFVDRRESI